MYYDTHADRTTCPHHVSWTLLEPPHASSSLSLRERHSFNQLKWTAERRSRNGESHQLLLCPTASAHDLYPLSRHEKQKKPEEELTPADQNVVANLR